MRRFLFLPRCFPQSPYPGVDSRIFSLLGSVGDTGADGVEVDIGHDGQQRGFVEQGLAFETTFPEAAGDAVFGIGLTGDVFVQGAHVPGEVVQALAVGLNQCLQCLLLVGVK